MTTPSDAAPSSPASQPHDEYRRRREVRLERVVIWRRRELTVSVSRLVAVVVGLVVAWLAIQSRLLHPVWILPPVLAFLVLLSVHDRVLRRLGRSRRGVAFYDEGLQRLEGRWAGSGERGERYLDPKHPYAADLDLFGTASLFELLCRARTRAGEDRLASWLLAPALPAEVAARQAGVAELRDRLDLREALFTLGGEVRSGLDPERLKAWAGEAPRLTSPLLVPVLAGLAVLNLVAAAGWAFWGWGMNPFLALVLLEVLGSMWLRSPVGTAIRGLEQTSRDLLLLSELLVRIEEEQFRAPLLETLQNELADGGLSPGREIRRLQRLVDLLDSRRNPMFAPFAALLMWTSLLACAVERWRREHGGQVVRWLEIVGELEALASLAAHAYEWPGDCFPEVLDEERPRLEGHGLGHPLLPIADCVRNDLGLGDPAPRVLVVSGSNMSGKSTFLRTTGTAVVMALAGAPVRASSLRLTPLSVGASIRVQDSLQEGSSRFYAEITRLRQILASTDGELPVLFLLDEILHGTNSHDRRIGAEAVVRAFVERGAIGLVTTHDLALARIADEGDGRYANVHFEDYLEEGKIHFDYRLRQGVVERSNALALMREVGLEV